MYGVKKMLSGALDTLEKSLKLKNISNWYLILLFSILVGIALTFI